MRIRVLLVACTAALALGATACASTGLSHSGSDGSGSPGPGGSGSSSASFDPLALVGSWQLKAPGQAAGSVLRLGDDLSLWSGCGYLMGDWSADQVGLFTGHISGGTGKCMPSQATDPTPGWLTKVSRFKPDGARVELLDSTGAVIATLTPGGHPTAGPDIAPQLAEPPTVTADLRARLRPAAPLPAGITAAKPAQLVGRWGSAEHPERAGFVDLSADGSWKGSDGANAQGGRWAADAFGNVVAVAGAQTAMGCGPPDRCVDVGGWFVAASRAGFDGSVLVLFDADGKVTGRLARATAGPTPTQPPGSPVAPGSSGPVMSSAVAPASPAPGLSSAG